MTRTGIPAQAWAGRPAAVPLPLALRLGADGVHLDVQGSEPPTGACRVWLLRLAADGAVPDALLPLLSDDEHARADAYRVPSARSRFIQVRGALRLLLGRCLHVPAARIGFGYGQFGKPALAHGGAWQFNVAHSGDYALLAIANGREVGVDIERHRSLPELAELARMVLSPAEAAAWHAMPAADRVAGFFAAWSAKEAVAKATGQGLGLGLERLEVGMADWRTQSAPRAVPVGAMGVCRLAALPAPEGYAAALALRDPAG